MSQAKERPILFNGEMVRALFEGRKTQSRRAVKPQPCIDASGNFTWNGMNFGQGFTGPHIQAIASPIPSSKTKRVHCPYGKPGDFLWVRETWRKAYPENAYGSGVVYRADKSKALGMDEYSDRHKWRPSIHMPRWASRITLEITDVRVERLQAISEDDAQAEGCDNSNTNAAKDMGWYEKPRRAFRRVWEQINGPDSWGANPWVWVIEFRRLKPGEILTAEDEEARNTFGGCA